MFAEHVVQAGWSDQQRIWLAVVVLIGATVVTALQMRTPPRHQHRSSDEQWRRPSDSNEALQHHAPSSEAADVDELDESLIAAESSDSSRSRPSEGVIGRTGTDD